jgi:hypothetical protein
MKILVLSAPTVVSLVLLRMCYIFYTILHEVPTEWSATSVIVYQNELRFIFLFSVILFPEQGLS